MHSFYKSLNVKTTSREFNFNRLYSGAGIRFYVSVMDNYQSYLFTMEKKMGEWKIIDAPKVPTWIHDREKELSTAIIEFISRDSRQEINSDFFMRL